MSGIVTIDGPAGSGKSTIARRVARALGVPHVDTGSYYRAAALAVLRAGADPADGPACRAAVRAVTVTHRRGRTHLDGRDVEAEIRGPAVTAAVSAVAAHPEVRELLVAAQRAAVGGAGGVVEGRDAGTVVVPDAALKVWLDASVEERGRRRARQRGEPDPEQTAAHIEDLVRRDAADADRMRPAADAVRVDTTGRSVEEVTAEVVGLAHRSGLRPQA